MNLAHLLATSAERHAERVAVRLDDRAWSYAELDGLVEDAAALLVDRGVRPGDVVGLMLPNVPQFAVAYYAILRAGAIVVPMNVLLKEREVAFHLGDAGAGLLVAWEGFAAEASAGAEAAGTDLLLVDASGSALRGAGTAPIVERGHDDTAVILYTSGTTGTPKGAELSHGNLSCNAEVTAGLLGARAGDVLLGALPLFHSFGQTCGLNAAIGTGATLTLLPRFDPEAALELLRRDAVTIFEGVPTMYMSLLAAAGGEPVRLPDLRVCVSGGAAMPGPVLRAVEAALGAPVLEGYGLSETSPVASFNQLDVGRKVGSIGTPVDGVEMRVVDADGMPLPAGEVGEIVIRGHNVMQRYRGRPDATAAVLRDGWFATGDLARVDEDGFFFIVDRKKDLVIRGGYNVYPREVEEVLYEHPAVRQAAVVGVPHPELGEEVGAAVALEPGASTTPEELRAFVRERVAAYKYPREVWLVDELPTGPTGKILKREIVVPTLGRR